MGISPPLLVLAVLHYLLTLSVGKEVAPFVSIDPPVAVGRSAAGRSHYWRPTGGVNFGVGRGVLAVSLRDAHGCCPDEATVGESTLFPCVKPCHPAYQMVSTVDSGKTFHTLPPETEAFCGGSSIAVLDGSEWKRVCPASGPRIAVEGDRVQIPQMRWALSPDGTALEGSPMGEERVYLLHNASAMGIEEIDVSGASFSSSDKGHFQLVGLREKGVVARSTGLFASVDGREWRFLSKIPSPLGPRTSLKRLGADGLVAILGTPPTAVKAVSRTMGKKWGKVTVLHGAKRPPALFSTLFTVATGGGNMVPLLTYERTSGKKGTVKTVNMAAAHNANATEGVARYEKAFIRNYKKKKRFLERCDEPPFNTSSMCASTGDIAFVGLSPEGLGGNATEVLVCYDQLHNGWRGPTQEDALQDVVYCSKATVDDATEIAERAEKVKRREEQRKRHEENQERARKQQEEAKERRRREQLEKELLDKQRRVIWHEMDKAYLADAQKLQELDGELVVVREVQEEWADMMADSVGMGSDIIDLPIADAEE